MLDLAPSRAAVSARPVGVANQRDPHGRPGTTIKVRLVDLQPGPTAVVRARMRPDAVPDWLHRAYRHLARALRRQQVSRSGPAYARYTVDGNLVEVEAGFRVEHPIVGEPTAVASGLPGGLAAVVTHGGGPGSLDAAYAHLEAWLDAHGYVEAGPHWEVYPAGVPLAPDTGPTEIVVPCCRGQREPGPVC